MNIYKRILLILTLVLIFHVSDGYSQNATISGRITEAEGEPVFPVNITVKDTRTGIMNRKDGSYDITVPSDTDLIIVYSFIGYVSQEKSVRLRQGESLTMDIILETDYRELGEVMISARQERATTMMRIDLKSLQLVPGTAGSVETIIKTLPGVSSGNELSSQYSVRGGNFDENLVYVNDIEIYRPFLIRSGQQEGLSFVNSDLISAIKFSAGGFEARYGDRMSSVLDITYKKPDSPAGSFRASLLGGSLHLEGISDNGKFTHLTGVRYKTTSYILNTLDVQGDYKPNFFDLQSLITYSLSKNIELSFLGNLSRNQYNFIPSTRRTDFGTASTPLNLVIYFEGNEADVFNIYQGAVSLKFNPSEKLTLKFISSGFNSIESEKFDILGEYLINELDNTIGSETYGDSILNIGIGGFLNHARNYLNANVYSASHIGEYNTIRHRIRWGLKHQYNWISDKLSEWEMIDSTGYSLPQDPDHVLVNNLIKASNEIRSGTLSGYLQDTWRFRDGSNMYYVTAGIRSAYLGLTNQFLISPRINFSIEPGWEKDIMFRISAGMYYQPPFYKEMRNLQGELNKSLKAQQSAHFLIGGDYIFFSWDRPFRLSAELYYKDLKQLVPYKIDNVSIKYAGENLAKGYAVGFDLKINGQFVPNAESWLSLSLMQTREDILNDFYFTEINGEVVRTEPGYYPRPTDQLFSAGLFFQDYLPNNPDYKVHLNLLYGSRLPYSSPKKDRFDEYYRLPPYRRADIGFSKSIKKFTREQEPGKTFTFFRDMWISAEIFNLLGMNNTISYYWVRTISNQENIPGMFAVPNYLTSRRFNLKITANF